MDMLLDFLKNDAFLIVVLISIIILLVLYVSNSIKLSKLRKNYKDFMNKLGKGDNIEDILKNYIKEVEKVEEEQKELRINIEKLENNINICVQKVGLVRYSAFKDTGSDLSFTLALLNRYNDGVVLNGIYSREMSNIYSKPIKDGKSNYSLSEEEKEAIIKAINS